MKNTFIFLVIMLFTSCIPLQYAPEIENYDIVLAKRFKNDLPRQYAFAFEDHKNANEFYKFVLWKLGRVDMEITENLPLQVGDSTYYMSFYERSKKSASINLIPLIINGEANGDELYNNEGEYWYILITVINSDSGDCLHPSYANRHEVILALKELKDEYLDTEF
ncbi:hypothetical protein [Lentiprolixibacter aurantiacus]|uniref:Lipoprotein n=1 Tax=Lentiprolixibacter aurantiacus TaxID=2993939 RepID=A0AAE3SNQ6_9FLAO|nr:hypothetical protein [Lentiprolixibacter aurantiacus]MCX2720012.1 hypothetical protein [Lentiprolixibacter aurantiacus]